MSCADRVRATSIGAAFGGRNHSTVAAAPAQLDTPIYADPDMTAEAEALRVSILAGAHAPTKGEPIIRQLAPAALGQTRITETEVVRRRAVIADLLATLETPGACGRTDNARQRARSIWPTASSTDDRAET